jgi:hypothetical protein
MCMHCYVRKIVWCINIHDSKADSRGSGRRQSHASRSLDSNTLDVPIVPRLPDRCIPMSSCIFLLRAGKGTGRLCLESGLASESGSALLGAVDYWRERDSGLYGHASLPLLTPDRGIAVDRLFSLLFEPLSNSLANTLSWVGLGCRGQKRSAKHGISLESRRRMRLQLLRKCCYSSAVFVTVSVSLPMDRRCRKLRLAELGVDEQILGLMSQFLSLSWITIDLLAIPW